jgi:uncharacterized 2Fe-2S/4Fe-4S cluster protein (DUF4445 family)
MAGIEWKRSAAARGRCRSCRVKVLAGEIPPPTVQDTIQLGHEEVHERFRLACQTRVIADCTVRTDAAEGRVRHQILAGRRRSPRQPTASRLRSQETCDHGEGPDGEHHQTSDAGEILALHAGRHRPHLPLEVLRKIPGALRKNKGRLTVTTFNSRIIDVEVGDTTDHCYGMAFDIGTTSIVGSLMDLGSGAQLAAVAG